MEEVIKEITKGKDEVIRIGVSEYEGHDFAQVRVWYDKDGDWRPTKKGVTFNIKNISEVIDALQIAKLKLEERAEAKLEPVEEQIEDTIVKDEEDSLV